MKLTTLFVDVEPAARQILYNILQENCANIEVVAEVANSKEAVKILNTDGLFFVPLDEIYFFKADGSYTNVIGENGKTLVSKKIKDFDDLLSANQHFF
jgi:two-component system, LytTR family, response regulator